MVLQQTLTLHSVSYSLSRLFYSLILAVFLTLFLSVLKQKTQLKIKKFSLIIISLTAVSGFVMYFIGYLENDNPIFISFLRGIFSMARMMLLEEDFSAISAHMENSKVMTSFWYLPAFWAVNAAAVFSFAFAVIALFGRRLKEQLLLFFPLGKTIYIICGLNERSLNLAQSLMEKSKRLVIVFDDQAEDDEIDKVKECGAIVIKQNVLEKGKLKSELLFKLGVKRYRKKLNLFLLDQDETYNLSLAKAILKEASDQGWDSNRLRLYLQSDDTIILREIDEILACPTNYEVNVISEAELAVRKLLEEEPIVKRLHLDTKKAAVLDAELSVLIIGFGKIGREALCKCICNGQFVGQNRQPVPLHITVVEPNWEMMPWEFRNIHQSMIEEYKEIKWEPISWHSEKFFQLLNKSIETINYIIIATEDDKENLTLARNIRALAEQKKISWSNKLMAVHSKNQKSISAELAEDQFFQHIKLFGEYEAIYTEDVIVNEIRDTVAKKINEHYNLTAQNESNTPKGNLDNWNELSLLAKNSNRSAAEHLGTKLALIGYEAEVQRSDSEFLENASLEDYINKDQMENLLRVEHLRWNAFHFVNGWSNYSKEEIKQLQNGQQEKLTYSQRKDKMRRKHACLVTWEELVFVSDLFGYEGNCGIDLIQKYPEYQYYQLEDLKQINNIPKFLHYAGIKVKQYDRSKANDV
jgi:hypothetical protein